MEIKKKNLVQLNLFHNKWQNFIYLDYITNNTDNGEPVFYEPILSQNPKMNVYDIPAICRPPKTNFYISILYNKCILKYNQICVLSSIIPEWLSVI